MRYIVTGRVHPERADIYFSRVELGVGEKGRAILSCDSSQLTVTLDGGDIDGWITARIRAEDLASMVVGALGFSLGSGYSVEMIQVTEEDGTPHVSSVRPANPEGRGETLAFEPHNEIFNRALRLAGRDIFFRLACRDYLQAINDTGDCATYCYRAIESIKSSFVFRSGQDRWEELHAALGTSRKEIESTIKQYADPVRHGNWVNAKPTDRFIRWRMLELTRDILKKYLDAEQPVI
jgi:hypothetical protein